MRNDWHQTSMAMQHGHWLQHSCTFIFTLIWFALTHLRHFDPSFYFTRVSSVELWFRCRRAQTSQTHTHTTQWKWQCGNVCRYEEIDKENLCTRSRCPRLYLKYFTTFFFRSFAMQIRFARIYAESRYISGAAAAWHEILAQTHLHIHTQGHWKLYLDRQPEVW